MEFTETEAHNSIIHEKKSQSQSSVPLQLTPPNKNFHHEKFSPPTKSANFASNFAISSPGSPSGARSIEFTSPSKTIPTELDDSTNQHATLRFRSQRLVKLHQRFSLPTTETLLETYVCALDKNFLLQGKLYVFDHYIAFYASMLRLKTFHEILCIPMKNIKEVIRENTLIFPNAIKIILKRKDSNDHIDYMFRSFLNREKTLLMICTGIIDYMGSVICDAQKITRDDIIKVNSTHSSIPQSPSTKKLFQMFSENKQSYKKTGASSPASSEYSKIKDENQIISNINDHEFSSSSEPDLTQLTSVAQTYKSNTATNEQSNNQGNQHNSHSLLSPQQAQMNKMLHVSLSVDTMNYDSFSILPPKYEDLDYVDVSQHEFNCSLKFFWNTFWDTNAKFPISQYMSNNTNVSNLQFTEWVIDSNVSKDNISETITIPQTTDKKLKTGVWYTRHVSFIVQLDNLPSFAPKDLRTSTVERIERCCKLNDNAIVVHRIIIAKDVPYGDAYEMHEKWKMRQRKKIVDFHSGNVSNINQINTFRCEQDTIKLTTNLVVSFAINWVKKGPWQFIKSQIHSRVKQGIKGDFDEKYTKIIDGKIAEYLQRPLAEQEIFENLEWLEQEESNIISQSNSKRNSFQKHLQPLLTNQTHRKSIPKNIAPTTRIDNSNISIAKNQTSNDNSIKSKSNQTFNDNIGIFSSFKSISILITIVILSAIVGVCFNNYDCKQDQSISNEKNIFCQKINTSISQVFHDTKSIQVCLDVAIDVASLNLRDRSNYTISESINSNY